MFELPAVVSIRVVFAIFLVALVLCHMLFLFVFPLQKRGWKLVDYAWLSVTAVGLIGAVAQGRQLIATNYMRGIEQARVDWYDPLYGFVLPANREQVACMQFVPSDLMPPEQLKAIQAQQDQYCAWYKQIEQRLTDFGMNVGVVERDKFPAFPAALSPSFAQERRDFESSLSMHNDFMSKRAALEAARERSEDEEMVAVLSPILLAVALALRITKVTGELRLG